MSGDGAGGRGLCPPDFKKWAPQTISEVALEKKKSLEQAGHSWSGSRGSY